MASHLRHKKRPSSVSLHSTSFIDTYNSSFCTYPFNGTHIPGKESQKLCVLERSPKRRSIIRPWTSAEQESLYIAVEKYSLYGKWHEVKLRMNLDRTAVEIKEEYTRLYAELPDSDQEFMDEDQDQNMDLEQGQDQASDRGLEHDAAIHTTPPTATSSGTPGAHLSQDGIANVFDHVDVSPRWLSSAAQPVDIEDDDDVDESTDVQLPFHYEHQLQHSSNDARPQRTVRVWTYAQSEHLKNLIEFYFPGAYRINWVWVASQMGNLFTRKQCKNKWEIMRRQMGTEDEINLLQQGYQEFGPSWGKIQEKYLPERSRGGISIMWDLLETRKAEEQLGRSRDRGGHHARHHSLSSLWSMQCSNASTKHGQRERPFFRHRTTKSEIANMAPLSPASSLYSMDEDVQSQSPCRSMELGRETAAVLTTVRAQRRSDVLLSNSTETWSDRNYPMTWTEPLTRRLEEFVHQHFPNHQKVNWSKVSSLMGNNPPVSRDQCKRRWYLIMQQHGRQGEMASGETNTTFKTERMETLQDSGPECKL
ncbi:hypothetical protein BGZ98_001796 [Dissophora globulifera]|nr:hypothetical protein BGZ98_001796 [Dissophora globulifera]